MTKKKRSFKQVGVLYGFRSGLEEKIAEQLNKMEIPFDYEKTVIKYLKPAKASRYTPDFVLHNGIIIETKGRFMVDDRQKHLLIKEQHPDLDIRFVFTSSKSKISKTSKTTYGDWCDKHGFQYADRFIPDAWLLEQKS
jgi:hypothetical protein